MEINKGEQMIIGHDLTLGKTAKLARGQPSRNHAQRPRHGEARLHVVHLRHPPNRTKARPLCVVTLSLMVYGNKDVQGELFRTVFSIIIILF